MTTTLTTPPSLMTRDINPAHPKISSSGWGASTNRRVVIKTVLSSISTEITEIRECQLKKHLFAVSNRVGVYL
jgi:hypothetical protein